MFVVLRAPPNSPTNHADRWVQGQTPARAENGFSMLLCDATAVLLSCQSQAAPTDVISCSPTETGEVCPDLLLAVSRHSDLRRQLVPELTLSHMTHLSDQDGPWAPPRTDRP
ncbi:hypothetical protein D4764_15G0000780 [Takifugu flavidus]|uniref:Uncharacterized protein n=1 Tax=Takifugu flavidus TaxID=433684 RepID=A0A5C6NYV3_9TELE|nr:hypothetical protein D4764_15G0000780 [Takifugu flavidus]